ncbi:cytochrome b/b6 domain-containing protein [Shewanella baltica]|uniref:cytochrome b n=1 Tax=Shewanella baltica TaxID=62322 RepID=UPI002871B3E7|nr:cytochrome b/b6 domain-containing protein [Shewanella baltica]MDR9767510.1 cytochrome b/b6 domain-containing protein [Shewanella baltica]
MIENYSLLQKILHWLSAAIIIWATISGFYIGFFNVNYETKELISFFNVAITTILIPFFMVRLYIYIHSNDFNAWSQLEVNKLLPKIAHFVIYVNIIIVLITGVTMMDRDINVFGFIIPQPITDDYLNSISNSIHIFSCGSLAFLILLHISAVVIHKLKGNCVMKRMKF